MKIFLLIFFLLLHKQNQCQTIPVLKILYERKIDGKLTDVWEVWMNKDFIFRFNSKDSNENSVLNFNTNSITINAFGRENTQSIEERKDSSTYRLFDVGDIMMYISKPEAGVNPFTNQVISETTDSIWFDKKTVIPRFKKGGFSSFLDNGFGLLPTRFVRNIKNFQESTDKIIELILIAKQNIEIDEKIFIKYTL